MTASPSELRSAAPPAGRHAFKLIASERPFDERRYGVARGVHYRPDADETVERDRAVEGERKAL